MMKTLLLLILLTFLNQDSYCDDIYLKDGTVYRNAQIISVDSTFLEVLGYTGLGGSVKNIVKKKISRADIVNYVKKKIFNSDISSIDKYDVFERDSSLWYKQKSFPHLGFLSVTILSFALCYDYLEDANSTQKSIDFYSYQLKQLGLTQVELKGQYRSVLDDLNSVKLRKDFVKWITLAVGVGSFIYAFIPERVEVKLTPINVGIKYNF